MSDFGWGVIGPGQIAQRFADAVHRLPGARLAGVHGRNRQRAQAFADAWSQEGEVPVFADLGAMIRDPAVQAVYIATPHAFHATAIRQCLEAGMPVLCEKPLVANATMAGQLIDMARQRRVFLMEALWTRFLPLYSTLGELLASQAIGQVRGVQSTFSSVVPFKASGRHFDPAQAGGALLDIGVYNLSMTQWVLATSLGRPPELVSLEASGTLGPTGVDHRVAGTLRFSDGAVSQFQCGFDAHSDNALTIMGERGSIVVPGNFWEATHAVLRRPGQPDEAIDRPFRFNGFEGEVEEAMRCIVAGDIESPSISHGTTLTVMRWMDRIRDSLGVSYPFE